MQAIQEQTQTPSGGPRQVVTVGQTTFTILGTAHVSRASAQEVRAEIESGHYDRVAIELCDARYQALAHSDEVEQMDLFQVVKKKKVGMTAANLALGAYQQRLADQFGIEPGAEMRTAIQVCEQADIPLLLIDRNIGVTLKRVYRRTPWWQRMGVLSALLGSLISNDKIEEDEIEQLKNGDMLEATFTEFARSSSVLHESLIDERDRYMAAHLLQTAKPGHTLVVIGAGHLKGMAGYLTEHKFDPEAEQTRLNSVPEGVRWFKYLPWLILALVLSGFVWGFQKSPELGEQLVLEWILIHGALCALGAAAALASPLSIIVAFLASPLTSLHPMVGAGMVVTAVELWVRKPRVGDFSSLKKDVGKVTGWWKNRVSRALLVYLFSSIGSAAGTWIAGARIVHALF